MKEEFFNKQIKFSSIDPTILKCKLVIFEYLSLLYTNNEEKIIT